MMLGSSNRAGAVGLLAVGLLASGAWAFRPASASPAREVLGQDPPRESASPGPPAAGPPPLVPEAAPVEKYRLDNGLTVILRPVAGTEDAALAIVYDIGTDHDPAGQSGLGHLVEHLYLTAAAGLAPARTTEGLMGRYPRGMNGQTGDRYTLVAAVFPAADLADELTDAAARMGALRVEARDLDRERPRLLEEVDNMFANFPPLAAQNNARELVRPTPGGGRRGGAPEAVGRLTVDHVQRRLDRYYRPRNATLVLAGKVDPVAARATIGARFGLIPPGEPVPPASEPGPAALGTAREVATPAGNPGDPPTVALAYPAPRPDDPLYAPFLVLILRLWAGASELAGPDEGSGLPVYFTPLDDGAVIAFISRAKAGESTDAATRRIEAFVARTIGPPLRPGEAGRAAEQLGQVFGTSPPPDSVLGANLYGVAFALARRQQLGIEPKPFNEALRAVTAESLQQAGERFLAPGRHAVAMVRR